MLPEENSAWKVTAVADSLIEAMELKNGLGWSFQFHPELMGRPGETIVRAMVDQARKVQGFRESTSFEGCLQFFLN